MCKLIIILIKRLVKGIVRKPNHYVNKENSKGIVRKPNHYINKENSKGIVREPNQ